MSFHKRTPLPQKSQLGAYAQVLLHKGDTITVTYSVTLLLTNR